MAEHASQAGSRVTRRRFLLIGALGVGAATAFGLLRGLVGGGNNSGPMASNDLPGKDSIFHPRRDANLDAYEQRSRNL